MPYRSREEDVLEVIVWFPAVLDPNTGIMPPEHPAIRIVVPVDAAGAPRQKQYWVGEPPSQAMRNAVPRAGSAVPKPSAVPITPGMIIATTVTQKYLVFDDMKTFLERYEPTNAVRMPKAK